MHSLTHGDDLRLTQRHQWKENRLKPGQSFVGLATSKGYAWVVLNSLLAHRGVCCSNRGVYSCTSNGALRLVKEDELQHNLTVLPTRLCCWQLSSDGKSFAYGGEEVEVSLWDVEQAFSHPIGSTLGHSQKRKRGGDLLPAETWRAKNVSSWVRGDETLLTRKSRYQTTVSAFGSQFTSPLSLTFPRQRGDLLRLIS